ncbi:nitroreductase/quinone reductase family protein [Herbiconiux sp. CPCC 205763]|uniref:Nitroreductase/quinone reductase family protein n=1 Tax=Herbiconiux aconitum TaxID=2970913 RepID=A0ABT2GQG5_9MICO|nr:nitroreductase/quinone reductase family protein [Herbiconiux aconitum]MCS5718371.1 nitroreductase/quinone reductase family protein [Herbiconiux aconitum]
MSDFNERIVDEFRANAGRVETGGFGTSLVLLHHTGAKSGIARVSPVLGLRQNDGSLFIAASKGGAPDHPAWLANLRAHPETSIEVPTTTGDGVQMIDVRADILTGADRDAGWSQFLNRSPGFAHYEAKAGGRVIAVVRLSPR